MLKLFAVMLGGKAHRCNTELHDVVFVVANSIQESHPQLISKWFGIKDHLHIDLYMHLNNVDGHEISITTQKPTTKKKLYFVNFGGYRPNYFGEVHEATFYVATSQADALARAKQELGQTLFQPHCDNKFSVDDVIAIDGVDDYHIELTPTTDNTPLKIQVMYKRLDI